jgi:hypothetical protein
MEASDAITRAKDIGEQQKRDAPTQADQIAKAVHGAAEELQKQMPDAAEFVHSAASRLEQGANALRERNISDLIGAFNDMGRKQPIALFTGSVVAGFAISRFIKSSPSRRDE